MINLDTHPFDAAIDKLRNAGLIRDALIEVGDTVEMAKKILLQNRVRDFNAADVLALTKMVMDREQVLSARADAANCEDDEQGAF